MKIKIHILVAIGAFLGAVSVVGGAFGTHSLQNIVSEVRLQTYGTGIRYLLIHAVALISVGLLLTISYSKRIEMAGWAILAGVLVFSGSLILLVLFDVPILGAITPVGGLLLISGWVFLGLSVVRSNALIHRQDN